jgi:hypothetical protein
MPTPESEAFKAKKPTVPPTFDGVDFRNNQQVWDARDAIIREQWVKQMMARLVRDELGKVTFSFDGVMCESYRFGAGGVCSVVSRLLAQVMSGRSTHLLQGSMTGKGGNTPVFQPFFAVAAAVKFKSFY